MGQALLEGASGFPCTVDAGLQILAGCGQDRQCLWRPEFVLFLPADRRIRQRVTRDSSTSLGMTNGHGGRSKNSAKNNYASGASSAADTTRVGTRRRALPLVSSDTSSPCLGV